MRCSSHIIEGLLPTSCICANKYNEAEVVDALRRELRFSEPLKKFQDEKTQEKLCKLDRVCVKFSKLFYSMHKYILVPNQEIYPQALLLIYKKIFLAFSNYIFCHF